MLDIRNLVKQLIYKSLALAVIFCLSGMMSIVCCLAKCQIVISDSVVLQNSACHESQETLSSLELEEESNCCSTEACEESESNSLENHTCQKINEESQKDYLKSSNCKMTCCLPSEEAVDITRVPRVDSTLAVNSLYLVLFDNITKDKSPLFLPVENLPSQEKTYLKCCVFLI